MSEAQELIETWFRRVWFEEDARAIAELYAADGRATGIGKEHEGGPPGFKQFHAAVCALMSNIRITVDKIIEDGEWSVALCSFEATGEATGTPARMTGNVWFQIRDGRILEAHNHWDFFSLFNDLGLCPADQFQRFLEGEKLT
jgi:ketosteroid isomerase-like protein